MAAPGEGILGQTSGYVQTLPYSDKRQFEPPRVQIPPPSLDYHNGKPCFLVSSLPFEQTSGRYGNAVFLKALTACHKLEMSHSMLSWQYEMRRTAQPILPFLLLGPSSVARDPQFIQSTGITLLVAVRNSRAVKARPTFLDPSTFPSGARIATMTFDFESPYDFIPNLRPVIKGINDHLEGTCTDASIQNLSDVGGKALIFCESGNDRSSVLVAAYLMVVFGIAAFSAIQIVQSQRFCITISDEMKNILLDLQHILLAERQVSSFDAPAMQHTTQPSHQQSFSNISQRSTKRSIDDVYASDEEMGQDTQYSEDFDIREGVAPFTDAVD